MFNVQPRKDLNETLTDASKRLRPLESHIAASAFFATRRKSIHDTFRISTIGLHTTLIVKKSGPLGIEFEDDVLPANRFATGDYFCKVQGSQRRHRIIRNTARRLEVSDELPFESPPLSESSVGILIRLQQPYVDPGRCIGCGICEHECPVRGKLAIRVTAENETRSREHRLIV